MANWIIVGSTGGTIGGGGGGAPTMVADKATFFAGFGNPLLPRLDVGVRSIISQTSTPASLVAYLSTPPVTGSFLFDILVSQNGGLTWHSILNNPVSMTASGPVVSTDFVTNVGWASFAIGNLLRLDVLGTGGGPGYSSGFQCVLTMNAATADTSDRATFHIGMLVAPAVGADLGGYYVVAKHTQPRAAYIHAGIPPAADTVLDLQVQHLGSTDWVSIFPTGGQPVIQPSAQGVMSTATFAPHMGFSPGDLIRPYVVSGPAAAGTGYSIVLDMEVLT